MPQRWKTIIDLTNKRSELLHNEHERQLANNTLRNQFAKLAEAFNASIENHRAEIVKIAMEARGTLEEQRDYLRRIESDLNKQQNMLKELEHCNQVYEDDCN